MEALYEDGLFGLLPMIELAMADFAVIEMWSGAFWLAVGKIMFSNIVLSGDNAVVIAMAAHNLPDRLRRRAIFMGSLGAILLRVLFCAVVGLLLGAPYLKLIGGALLLWIGIKLITEEAGPADVKSHVTLWGAISTIVIADAVMSFDNAIAIAAAAHGNFALITIGLLLSIPIIMVGATLIARLLDRYPWIGIAGAALIGWIAGDVIAGDGRFERLDAGGHLVQFVRPGSIAEWFDSVLRHPERALAAWGAGFVLIVGLYLTARRRRPGKGPGGGPGGGS
jgi:YjbE family integral membrane protein